MTDQELIAALRWNMLETGDLICLGCGHEHGCGDSDEDADCDGEADE